MSHLHACHIIRMVDIVIIIPGSIIMVLVRIIGIIAIIITIIATIINL